MKPYEKLLKFWAETSAGISGSPADASDVAQLETRLGVSFPNDFRDYLLHAVPYVGEAMDANMTTWWNISRIASEQDEYAASWPEAQKGNPHGYIIFADYMIWCWGWAIACGNTEERGKIIVLHEKDRDVANDFATFIDKSIDMSATDNPVLA
jgi:hypothetical protein